MHENIPPCTRILSQRKEPSWPWRGTWYNIQYDADIQPEWMVNRLLWRFVPETCKVVLGFVDTFYICGCLKKNTIKDIWWENEWSKLEGYRMNIPFLLVYFHSYLVDFTNNCTYDKSSKYSVQYSQVQWQKPLIVDTAHCLKIHVWIYDDVCLIGTIS